RACGRSTGRSRMRQRSRPPVARAAPLPSDSAISFDSPFRPLRVRAAVLYPGPRNRTHPFEVHFRSGRVRGPTMADIRIYVTSWCGFCRAALRLLDELDLEREEVDLTGDPEFRRKVFDLTGGWTVPQIVIDGQPIGGYAELRRLHEAGRLARLLAA